MNEEIDVYSYIAKNSPRDSKRIIRDFGYTVSDSNLSENLRQLVNEKGSAAVVEIMKIHPDVEYFQEAFSKATNNKQEKKSINQPPIFKTQKINNNKENNGVIMLACTMILAIAIITYK